jgi:hypothetical protein
MPCRDDRDYQVTQGDVDAAAHSIRAELEPLLCEACAFVENEGNLKKLSPALRKWYEAHSKREQARVALEAAKKLTIKERKALGLDLTALNRAYQNGLYGK